ncbi:LysR family transcriptional regulator [Spirillospora sp. NPDC047279]|uniref:LysR family transcriptional regulator n=1 Tax=Spirillospora sp. NPDC047279 TaxID=3155478 RepID=UPI0033C85F09
MDRVETRELAYFLAVAQELHFGRAAARLGIAQPPLSRAIKQLERRLGVVLLDRDSRGVALTPAGEVLAREAVVALDAVTAAARRTRRAGLPAAPRLVVVMKPGGDAGLLREILAAYEALPEAVDVEVMLTGVAERARLLRDGTADVAFLHDPYEDLTGFDTEPLVVEGAVAVLPSGHALAGRSDLRMSDLDGEPLPRWRGVPGSGRPDAPEVGDPSEVMQLIALGRMAAVVPESARLHLRRDLVCVPVVDAAPVTVLLAWPENARSPALAAFVRTAAGCAQAQSRSA